MRGEKQEKSTGFEEKFLPGKTFYFLAAFVLGYFLARTIIIQL